MKNKGDKTNKIVAALNYFTSLCFYVIAILNFSGDDPKTGTVFMCLGVVFSTLGTVWVNKENKKE